MAAATDLMPELRYTTGPPAGRTSTLGRVVPSQKPYAQIRKYNRLPR